jgi:AcrR family transcriptional regulator
MTTERTIRADARRNREKLLAAAVDAFAEHGTNASLEEVARRAGVGIGTLYRHFPTRAALVESAYRNEVDLLCRAADELLERHPSDEALARWMDRFVAYAAAKQGMKSALHELAAAGADPFAGVRGRMLEAIGSLLAAGVAAGTIRADVDAEDVLRAMGAVWLVDDAEQARRLLRLLMDGLRYGS